MYLLFNFDLLNWLLVITFCLFSFRNSVTFSYDDTHRKRTSLRRLQDVLKRLQRLMTKPDALKTSGRRRLIYVLLKTSDLRYLEKVVLRRLEDVWFTTSWRRRIFVLLKTSDLQCLEEVCFTTSWRRLIYNLLKMSVERRLCGNVVATSKQQRKK